MTEQVAGSGEAVAFDLEGAVKLQRTPRSEKPNSARSATPVRHLGEVAGQLYVIVFAPGDGTGDENTHSLDTMYTGRYPYHSKVVPRDKGAAHSEMHLTLASFGIDNPNADPVLFAGNQQLLGLRGRNIVQLGVLGQPTASFQSAMAGEYHPDATTTLTVGYDALGGRFGDPHAVYNAHPEMLQVCGFIALTPEAANRHEVMLRQMQARMPGIVL
jgi:hypothetical protein